MNISTDVGIYDRVLSPDEAEWLASRPEIDPPAGGTWDQPRFRHGFLLIFAGSAVLWTMIVAGLLAAVQP